MQLQVSKRYHLHNADIKLSGAKNAVLHLLFASLLVEGTTIFENVPSGLHDYHAVCDILQEIGATIINVSKNTIAITAPKKIHKVSLSGCYTRKTRASLMLLGALAKRVNKLKIGYPGGCSFSEDRPFDIHLQALKALGANITYDNCHIAINYVIDRAVNYKLRYPSVGATINLMLYAAVGYVKIKIYNIALEPEVIEVAKFLNCSGAKIKIDFVNRIMHVEGVDKLLAVKFKIMYDRIQTMTYAALGYLHRLNVCIHGIDTEEYIKEPLKCLKEMGLKWSFDSENQCMYFYGKESKVNPVKIVAKPHPGFPTDLQPIFAVLCIMAHGVSEISDTVYPQRFKYVYELQKINFPIEYMGNGKVRVYGRKIYNLLHGNVYMKSYDLRAGMAVVMAASLSNQICTITAAEEIFRGYENLLENLTHFMHINVSYEIL